ncbi:circadian clock protein KaiC [Rhodopseudomonas pseudopalustris]|uniref:non-specific serine/threonine protein kinase n=1 Tax=Rhodopseudomonas pseudopalustris TaxID=1513892 RepID=A0A1H8U2T4_9BRAD|nr:circadian clock protein KaiC [Rhodopseudomonas pseudopalustris]MBB1091177.1 circadian clock protein KaiC [Rhodopseudomonas palustris]SEO97445.1 circadian clock protein KaiC [Rhodopseudomonas pseudopalustris]
MTEGIAKSLTGIEGFDELTLGGLPSGRPSLVCGSAGCGKTLFASTFLINGARLYGEPGVFVTFEERPVDIVDNVQSLGFDLQELIDQSRVFIEHIALDPSEIAEVGDYDLEALFLRLEYAVDQIGAKRIVLDTIESLFSAFSNPAVLRAEIRRLFDWLKQKGLTAVITGERGDGTLTRQGLEEYVSDCVILLDHRVDQQISTRRLRIVKYRGTAHGTNEYPFLIDEDGFSVLPVSSLGLTHQVFEERISTGVRDLDRMLTGGGFYRGNSVLVSGVAGSGKSSLSCMMADAACRRGEKALYMSFEESEAQTARNMKSVGTDLGPWLASGQLRYIAARPTFYSLEMHLAVILREVTRFKPDVVVLDPISAFLGTGQIGEVQAMLLRIVDYLKSNGITGVFTHLAHGQETQTDAGLSSLMDAWILLLNREAHGEFNRELYLLKARGISHSNQVREFVMSDNGIHLLEPYLGEGGALTGSARRSAEARAHRAEIERQAEVARVQGEIAQRRSRALAQIEALQAEIDADESELRRLAEIEDRHVRQTAIDSDTLARSRGIDHAPRTK